MIPVFLDTLRRMRGQMIGWGIGLALFTAMVIPFHTTMEQQAKQIEAMMRSMPPALLTAFDVSADSYATPLGFLNSKLFSSLPLVFGIFAVLAGSALLAQDEEKGRLDLLMAHPVSRTTMFWGRVAAALVTLLGIALIGWLAAVVTGQGSKFPATALDFLWPYLSLALTLAPVMMLGLLLSMILPSRKMAGGVAGLALVASYFLSAFSKVDDRLLPFARLLPLHYYQSGHAMTDGLNPTYTLGLLVATVLLGLAAWWLFQRRDLRVAGEGGWQGLRPRTATR